MDDETPYPGPHTGPSALEYLQQLANDVDWVSTRVGRPRSSDHRTLPAVDFAASRDNHLHIEWLPGQSIITSDDDLDDPRYTSFTISDGRGFGKTERVRRLLEDWRTVPVLADPAKLAVIHSI